LRNWIVAGNPLYPLFTSRFGTAGLYAEQNYAQTGVPQTFGNFLRLPYLLTFAPDFFERHSWMGPYFLLSIPFAVAGWWKGRLEKAALLVAGISLILWFRLGQNVRFLLPVFPLLILASASGFSILKNWWVRRPVRTVSYLFGIGLIVFLSGVGIYHYRIHLLALAAGWEQDRFLNYMERSYPAAQWGNSHLPGNAKIFMSSEVRQFYFDQEIIDEMTYYRVERYSDSISSAEVLGRLKQLGITHLVRVNPENRGAAEKPERSIIDPLLADKRTARFLAEIPSLNKREKKYHYAFYEILPKEKS
jgi:hypothetical protein